jgi:hypothetical protein
MSVTACLALWFCAPDADHDAGMEIKTMRAILVAAAMAAGICCLGGATGSAAAGATRPTWCSYATEPV